MPVSYTHLDVYKRQYLLYLAAGAALLFLCVSWVLVLPLFVLERKSLWPVSYTHLDVYKRQGQTVGGSIWLPQ